MLERFKLPMSDDRLVQCRQKIYKVKMTFTPSTGTRDRDVYLPCSEDSMHKEIELVLRSLLCAVESGSLPEKIQTQHFAIRCFVVPWKLLATNIVFKQDSKELTPHPQVLVLDIRPKERSAHYHKRRAQETSESRITDADSISSPPPGNDDMLSVIDMEEGEAVRSTDADQTTESSEESEVGRAGTSVSLRRSARNNTTRSATTGNKNRRVKANQNLQPNVRKRKLVDRNVTRHNSNTTGDTNRADRKYSVSRKSVRVLYDSSESEGRRSTRSSVKRLVSNSHSGRQRNVPSPDGTVPVNKRVKTRFQYDRDDSVIDVTSRSLPHLSVNLGERVDCSRAARGHSRRRKPRAAVDPLLLQESRKLQRLAKPTRSTGGERSASESPPPRRKRVTPSRMSLIDRGIQLFVKTKRSIFQTNSSD